MKSGTRTSPAETAPRGQRATVLAKCANGMFRLQTTDGRELMAHVAQDLRMAVTRLLPGDQVIAEPSPFDPTKARICKLLPTVQRSSQPKPNHQPQPRELS
jgi:translation initiation factor IF-1